jgi:hypothetical protein
MIMAYFMAGENWFGPALSSIHYSHPITCFLQTELHKQENEITNKNWIPEQHV